MTATTKMKECVLEFLATNARWESSDGLKRPVRELSFGHLTNISNRGYLDGDSVYCSLSKETWREVVSYEISLRHKAMMETIKEAKRRELKEKLEGELKWVGYLEEEETKAAKELARVQQQLKRALTEMESTTRELYAI